LLTVFLQRLVGPLQLRHLPTELGPQSELVLGSLGKPQWCLNWTRLAPGMCLRFLRDEQGKAYTAICGGVSVCSAGCVREKWWLTCVAWLQGSVVLDRTLAGSGATSPLTMAGAAAAAWMWVDGSVVELYANGTALSTRVYPLSADWTFLSVWNAADVPMMTPAIEAHGILL
jgi:hypothetical protein